MSCGYCSFFLQALVCLHIDAMLTIGVAGLGCLQGIFVSFVLWVLQIVQEQKQRRLVKHLLAMAARISKFVLLLPKGPIQV